LFRRVAPVHADRLQGRAANRARNPPKLTRRLFAEAAAITRDAERRLPRISSAIQFPTPGKKLCMSKSALSGGTRAALQNRHAVSTR